MDSSCCNHMTPHSSLFSQLDPTPHPLNIRTTNGSTMFGHNVGSISTSNLSVPGVFNVPNLSYNLFSADQLAELGYHITFNYSRCIMQDPRVGRMFPMDNLRLPPIASVFRCCYSCCSFFYSFPNTLACRTCSRIFLLGTTLGF